MRGIEFTPEDPVDVITKRAVIAEREDFDVVLTSCHYNNRDPLVALSQIATRTSQVNVGPAAANPYDIHPARLCSAMATLNEASEGRAIMGIAPGDASTLTNLGISRNSPLRRVLETMRVARELWDGQTVSHDGTFTLQDASLNYDVGNIPIFVGAQGPHMLQMSAKYADGVLVNASHPNDYEWASKHIEKGLKDRVRGDDLDRVAYVCVSIAEDENEAREAARPPVAFVTSGAPDHVLDRHGVNATKAATIGQHIERGEFNQAFELVSQPMIDAFAAAGDPEAVSERLSKIRPHVDGFVIGAPLGPREETAISLAATALDRLNLTSG
ncbi:MAG: 5,10-methylenetetrahydromethanopterin reductase [Halobacteriaceae archaeon]